MRDDLHTVVTFIVDVLKNNIYFLLSAFLWDNPVFYQVVNIVLSFVKMFYSNVSFDVLIC